MPLSYYAMSSTTLTGYKPKPMCLILFDKLVKPFISINMP